jgi:uncharacterized Ntn-hydrolase superfamily protein
MTFSIVARSDDGRSWGVAVASKFLAVGSAVPAAAAGIGAVTTQSFANVSFKKRGLTLLEAGLSAQATLDALLGADDGREERQVGIVDVHGNSATFTGTGCNPWAGGRALENVAAQGNILVGPEVVDAMIAGFEGAPHTLPLAHRLLAALLAGDRAGGDSRGRQSAALLVVSAGAGYGGFDDVQVDLRVDDHADPVAELERLLEIHDILFGKPDPDTLLPLTGNLAREVSTLLAGVGISDASVEDGLRHWAGIENYEDRLVPGQIDPIVLAKLRETVQG